MLARVFSSLKHNEYQSCQGASSHKASLTVFHSLHRIIAIFLPGHKVFQTTVKRAALVIELFQHHN